MGWEWELFATLDELEQQAGALYEAERRAEVADRSRAAYAEVTLASRLMAALGERVGLEVTGVGRLEGRLARLGTGWLLLVAHDHEWVVRLAALGAVHGAPARAVPEVAWPAASRLGLASALRRLGESGQRCVVHRVDGAHHEGVVRRVGADFAEVEVLGGSGARPERRVVLVAVSGLAAVQSREGG